jgi:hypothetical protein
VTVTNGPILQQQLNLRGSVMPVIFITAGPLPCAPRPDDAYPDSIGRLRPQT